MRSIVTYLPRKPLIDIILFFKGLKRKILAMLQFTKCYNILLKEFLVALQEIVYEYLIASFGNLK